MVADLLISSQSVVQNNSSPIFPSDAFSPIDASFNIPENEIISSGGISLSIVLAEPVIFLRGFTSQECVERPPSLLRGTLVVRVNKSLKIKTISLTFKGVSKTNWPEGIPPKRVETMESKDLYSHTWPFFNAMFSMSDYSSGANMVRKHRERSHRHTMSLDPCDTDFPSTHLAQSMNRTSLSSTTSHEHCYTHRRTASTPTTSNSLEYTKGVRALAGKIRRAASPSPSSTKEPKITSTSIGAHHNHFKDERVEMETQSKGYRTFEPGEYFYNFELPIPQSLPESIENKYGSVSYTLEATIERPGAFRTKVSGRHEVIFVRCPADNNIEINEPISISKPWDDQLYYDIVISGKAFPIGTRIPIAFKLTPLAKIELHRIRIYITENSEYFCKNKRVHRIEPTKKFLLEELISKDGLSGNLFLELISGAQFSDDEVTAPAQFEFESLIPESFPNRRDILHPNTTFDNIKVHNWIKVVLRISRPDPLSLSETDKKKCYEISIESPIHLLDQRCTTSNVYLPAYIDPESRQTNSTSLCSPVNNPLPPIGTSSPILSPSIQFSKNYLIAPPPFEQNDCPRFSSDLSLEEPPNYESATKNEPSYMERFASYQQEYGEEDDSYVVTSPNLNSPTVDLVLDQGQENPGSNESRHTTSTAVSSNPNRSARTSQSTQDSTSLTSLSGVDYIPTSMSARQSTLNVNEVQCKKPDHSDFTLPPSDAINRWNLQLDGYQDSTTSVDIVDQFKSPGGSQIPINKGSLHGASLPSVYKNRKLSAHLNISPDQHLILLEEKYLVDKGGPIP